MTDDVERASAREEEMRADALAEQARRAGLAGKTVADSAKVCAECGERIPLKRRRAVPGCKLCAACKADLER